MLSQKVLKNTFLIVLFLFFAAFAARFFRLSETPIYPDEITWMVRAKETALAVRTGNFTYFKTAWWTIKTDTEAIAIPLSVISGFPLIYLGEGQSPVSRNLLPDYIAARLPVIIFSSLFVASYYLFAKKYFNRKVALLASSLLLLDPIFAANSKIVMNDVFLTAFIFLSASSYLTIKDKKVSVLLSSIFAASAFLTKPLGLIVMPVFLLQIFFNAKNFKEQILKFVLTGLLTFIFISVFWPTSWANPLFAILEYIFRQKDLVGAGINNYFFGKVTNSPPFYYYLWELVTRLPPIAISGFTLSIFLLIKGKNKLINKNNLSIIILMTLFLAVISFSAKKLGIRYALPLIPWIYLFSSAGLFYFLDKIKNLKLKFAGYSLLILWFFGVFIYYFPYHDLYYNFLVGGPAGAASYDLVGLCEGSKPAVDYILKCYPSVKRIGAFGCGNSTIPYYYPFPYDSNWKKDDVFFAEAYLLQLNKNEDVVNYVNKNIPSKIIIEKGAIMAYIFAKPNVVNKCE